MTILGFSTSTDASSLAIFLKTKSLKPFSWTRKDQQSEALTLHIKKYLKKNNLQFTDLDLIAVDVGPGSFTGARIAVNIAKTISFELKIPVFTSSSLDIMAWGARVTFSERLPFTVFSILDAHRSLFYFQKYEIKNSQGLLPPVEIQALSLEQIVAHSVLSDRLYLLGNLKFETFTSLKDSLQKLRPNLTVIVPKSKKNHYPQSEVLVHIAASSHSSVQKSWAEVEPMYIRTPLK